MPKVSFPQNLDPKLSDHRLIQVPVEYERSSSANDKIKRNLIKVVRRHLTPPPSSTNVERLFSYGGLVATDHRSSLSCDKIDQILFLRENVLMANFSLGWL